MVLKKALWCIGGSSLVLIAAQLDIEKPTLPKLNASWTTYHNTPEPPIKWNNDWDKRLNKYPDSKAHDGSGDASEAVEKPKASRHIFLIRHGQYTLDGDDDKGHLLTALGKEQAGMTGKRLKELNIPINRIVISTMARAQETGKIISDFFPDVEPEHTDLIREGAPIPPEPGTGHWRPEAKFFVDGARIEAGFRKYFHRAPVEQQETSYELYVCHANVIRYYVCRALQLPPEAWLRMSLHNGSITWIIIRPNGRVSLRMLGDCGYMPADKLSFT